jgi:hypothetical protein
MSSIQHLVVALAWLLLASPSAATFISQDLVPGSGDGLITYDLQTGIEWLDITATTNVSYNQVRTGYGGYTTADGFRFANSDQLTQLCLDAGVTGSGFEGNLASAPGAKQLLDLLGSTYSDVVSGSFGENYNYVSATGMVDGRSLCSLTVRFRQDGSFINGTRDCGFAGPGADTASSGIGSWLVRPIPEPSTLLLVSLGLIGLSVRDRLRSQVLV